MRKFILKSKFKPTGDQPEAIKRLTENLRAGDKNQVLLGVTGSGKTFTLANVIARAQKPTLIISPNKTLAAQLYQEFKEFFPNNAVHYFVSYYDYYQPEAYIPQTDTYIEKDAKINQEIDRLRHAAVQDLQQRKDAIVVASVSCIYNLGSPEQYQKAALEIHQGQKIKRKEFLGLLVALQYKRNDIDFRPGMFRARGDVVEISLVSGEGVLRVGFLGDTIERVEKRKELSSLQFAGSLAPCRIYPANFWTTTEEKMRLALTNIKTELGSRLKELKKQKKLLEAKRLEQRTNYDLEMMRETGVCAGIENYSRHLEFRNQGEPPFTLLDYFPDNFLCVVDESHMTIPQLHAMYKTDKARKKALVEHGFRLKSAFDNRPLSFSEFEKKVSQVIYSSATPGERELSSARSARRLAPSIVEQLVRPTGLLEPTMEVRPIENQVRNLIGEIKKRAKKNQRTLAITLTKKMAEDLADFLKQKGIKAQYLHSEVQTLERPKILQKFRQGEFDVIVGINLLREGLDLPEVSLVGILDADKEGFLRNETTLIQTMGRAARHLDGHCILYADSITGSMQRAIKEVERRRKIQISYNKKHNIAPKQIIKAIRDWDFKEKEKGLETEFGIINDKKLLEKEMKIAAANLDFERAAELRDLIKNLQK